MCLNPFVSQLTRTLQLTGRVRLQVKRSKHAQRKIDTRNKDRQLDTYLDDQFTTGRLFACISSRPGQCGRADG